MEPAYGVEQQRFTTRAPPSCISDIPAFGPELISTHSARELTRAMATLGMSDLRQAKVPKHRRQSRTFVRRARKKGIRDRTSVDESRLGLI